MDLATELDSLHPMCSNFVAVHHNQWDKFFWPFLKETVEHIRPTLRDVIIRYINLPPAPILDPDEKWYRLQCGCLLYPIPGALTFRKSHRYMRFRLLVLVCSVCAGAMTLFQCLSWLALMKLRPCPHCPVGTPD